MEFKWRNVIRLCARLVQGVALVSGILDRRWQPCFVGERCWPDRLSSWVGSRVGESAQTAQARESTDAIHLNLGGKRVRPGRSQTRMSRYTPRQRVGDGWPLFVCLLSRSDMAPRARARAR